MKTRIVGIVCLVVLLMSGCARAPGPTLPATPVPPQVRVLQAIEVAAIVNESAAVTLNRLCAPPPQIDAPTCATAAKYVRLTVKVLGELKTETNSTDAWPVMRVKLAGIAASATVNTVVTNPAIQIQIAAIQTAVMAILGVTQ